MKKLTFVLFAILSVSILKAEDSKFEKAIKETSALLQSAKSPAEMQEAIGKFTRISQAEPTRWEAQYYLAYAQVSFSFWQEDAKTKEALLDEAQKGIDKALELDGDKSELLVLQAFVHQGQIQASPMRAMSLSPKVMEILNSAIKENPNNPRAYFLLGQQTFYTPAAFGGGRNNALPLFERASQLFEDETEKEGIGPKWGAESNAAMLKKCKEE